MAEPQLTDTDDPGCAPDAPLDSEGRSKANQELSTTRCGRYNVLADQMGG